MTNNPTIDGVSRVLLAQDREMRVYIAGPMTGIENYNFPAFNAVAENMRAAGWHVENPADHGLVPGAEWGDYLRYDIGCLASCEAIMLLPGWTASRGARLEVSIAKELGVAFMYAEGAEHAPAVERQEPAKWAYCPECGSEEIHHEEGTHKQCAECHQEWFSDLDYTDVVRKHLSGAFTDKDSTIAQLQARVQELESGRGEVVYQVSDGVSGWHDVERLKFTACQLDPEEYECRMLFAAAPAQVSVVPEGWKLVPVEPTAEMLENLAAEIYPDDKEAGLRLQRLRGTNVVFPKHEIEMAVGKYARMLDAAPACLDATAALNGPAK